MASDSNNCDSLKVFIDQLPNYLQLAINIKQSKNGTNYQLFHLLHQKVYASNWEKDGEIAQNELISEWKLIKNDVEAYKMKITQLINVLNNPGNQMTNNHDLNDTMNKISTLSLNQNHDDNKEWINNEIFIDIDDSEEMNNSFLMLEDSVNFGKYLFCQFERFCHQINGYQNSEQEPFWQNIIDPSNIWCIKNSVEIFNRFQMKTFKYSFNDNNDNDDGQIVKINSVSKDNDNINRKVNIFSIMKRIEYYILDLLNLCEMEYQFQMLITLALQQFEFVKSVKVEYGPIERRNICYNGRIDVYYEDYADYEYVIELKLIKTKHVCHYCQNYGMLSEIGREKFKNKFIKVDEVLISAFWQSKSYQKYNRKGFGAIILVGNEMKSIGVVDKILYINNEKLDPNEIKEIDTIKKWLKSAFGNQWHLHYIQFFVATWFYWINNAC